MPPRPTDEEILTDPLAGQPDGTVEYLGGGRYLVKGRASSYLVRPATGECQCPDHQYRRVPGEDCRHLTHLRMWFDTQGLITCVNCEGAGCEKCDRRGVVEKEAGAAEEMTDEELRALFA